MSRRQLFVRGLTLAALVVFASTQVVFAESGSTAAPLSVRTPSLTGKSRVGSSITATSGSWQGRPQLFHYQWARCNSRGADCVPIRHANGRRIYLNGALLGQTLRVLLTASNPFGSAASISPMTYRIAGGAGGSRVTRVSVRPDDGGWWSDSSFWNQPIPRTATVDGRSRAWTTMLLSNENVQAMFVNHDLWSINIHHANAGTPSATVAIENSGKRITIPYQAGWNGTPDSDSHLAVIDDTNGCEYEFQGFDAGNKAAVAVEVNNIRTGSGAHVADAGVGGGQLSLLGGLITPQDVKSGSIDHALRIATPVNSPGHVLPAVDSDGTHAGGIPEGQLLRLDPNLDLGEFNLNTFQKMVARALQSYGAYNADSSSTLTMNTESTFDGSSYKYSPTPLPKSLIGHLEFLNPLYSRVPLGSNNAPGCAHPR